MGLLGLSVQVFGRPSIISRVPAGSFYPPPKVESAVVKIEVYDRPVIPDAELAGFFKMARAAFCAARKQIQNSLAQGLGWEKTEIVGRLNAAGIEPRRRAETLSYRMAKAMADIQKGTVPTLTLSAPAKVNLTLEVLGRRDDDYHEIRSVMQTVRLCDSISFSSAPQLDFHCDLPIWQAEKSLVSHAAGLLQQESGCRLGARLDIKKRIPLSSGLGGDSSDAATALMGLNELWRLGIPPGRLVEMAAGLGSDVPFFLTGGTRWPSPGRVNITLPAPERCGRCGDTRCHPPSSNGGALCPPWRGRLHHWGGNRCHDRSSNTGAAGGGR
jgi:hypothetical protein